MAKMPVFAGGTLSQTYAAIKNGTLFYPAYVLIRMDETSEKVKMGFVDKGNILKLIEGENKKQILNVSELPNVVDADTEVVYIVGTNAYVFDGTSYFPLGGGQDYSDAIAALEEKVNALEENFTEIENIVDEVAILNEKVKELEASTVTFIELE